MGFYSGTGRTLLLDDGLQTAAGDLGNAICAFTEDQGAENTAAVDLCLGSLDKADTGNLADFALIQIVGLGILVGIDPLRITHQVIGHIGMDDGNILAADGGSILCSQLCDHLLDNINSELAGVVQSLTRGAYLVY